MNLHIYAMFTMPFIGQNDKPAYHLTLARSRSVNCHVIIPLDIGHLKVFKTKPLSPAFLEMGPKDNWVTILTFLGHVTSSVTWQFDSPYPTSYWCSIVTKPLSPALFKILGSKLPVQCKLSLRMRDITWPVPLGKIWVHIWISHPHIAYSLWHFYWAPMKNKGW